MAKTRVQKEEQLAKMSNGLRDARGAAFVSFSGVTVKQLETMRKSFAAKDMRLQVTKKRLLKLAAKANNLDLPQQDFTGEIAVVYSMQDEVGAAREAVLAGKKLDNWNVVGGVLEHAFISANSVKQLAALPTRQEMIQKTVGTIAAPLSGFVNIFAGSLRNLVYALKAIKDAKPAGQ